MRKVEITRNTKETKIKLTLNVDGSGKSNIDTKVGFLDHMLTLFASHGKFDLDLVCDGDVDVDFHHTTEDIGIALGEAFEKAIGDKKGINRYANIVLPMDEALVMCSVDVSGRDYYNYGLNFPTEYIGSFASELVDEFYLGFVRNFKIALHFTQFDGRNSHHIAEASFKAFARCLNTALSINEKYKDEIPSTKGIL